MGCASRDIFDDDALMIQAERCFRECLKRKADYIPAMLGLGGLLREQGNEEEGKSFINQATVAIVNPPTLKGEAPAAIRSSMMMMNCGCDTYKRLTLHLRFVGEHCCLLPRGTVVVRTCCDTNNLGQEGDVGSQSEVKRKYSQRIRHRNRTNTIRRSKQQNIGREMISVTVSCALPRCQSSVKWRRKLPAFLSDCAFRLILDSASRGTRMHELRACTDTCACVGSTCGQLGGAPSLDAGTRNVSREHKIHLLVRTSFWRVGIHSFIELGEGASQLPATRHRTHTHVHT